MKRKGKSFLSVVLSLAIAIIALFQGGALTGEVVYADSKSKVWNGKSDTSWYTGDMDYYEISTAEQLAGLSELVDDNVEFQGVTIALTKDIVLNKTNDFSKWDKKAPKNQWKIIGSKSDPFCGVFNGQGHTIEGLYLKDNERYSNWFSAWYADGGLFGYLCDATVVNLKMKKTYIETPGVNGIVTSFAQNTYFMGVEVKDAVIKGGDAGGIVGKTAYDYTSLFLSYATWIAMAGTGVWFNPLIFGDSMLLPNDFSGTIIFSSKVNGLKCIDTKATGGMIGYGGDKDKGFGIVNSLVMNTTFKTNSNKGSFMGVEPSNDYAVIKNCYNYNVKVDKKSEKKELIDKKSVKTLKKNVLFSSGAKKLGKAFEQTKGKEPNLKLFKSTTEVADESVYKTIEDGYYYITYGSSYLNITDNNDVEQSSEPQRFKLTYRKGGFYTIEADDGRCIACDDNDVIAEKKKYSDHRFTEKWVIEPRNESYYIKYKRTGDTLCNLGSFLFSPGRGIYLDGNIIGGDTQIAFHAIWDFVPAE